MCGIVGILRLTSDASLDEVLMKKMISSLHHRGPDGWGFYLTREIALGHSRLSILDLTGGNQPMVTDRFVISFNGEIYNHIELRNDLKNKGVRFKTSSDTEVVIKAFELFGKDAFQMFNGQFAMLIWDRLKKRLIAARDRYGIRPLYILSHGGDTYFSSEMKAFDNINGYHRTINPQKLNDHALVWNTLGDETIYNDIRSLPAGTFEVFKSGGGSHKHRYYEIGESQGESLTNIESAIEEFNELLDDSVRIRLRADVPVGAYLSGGIDSSVITHLAALHKGDKLKTFSVGFADSEFDESVFQDEMVSHINSDHEAININNKLINDNLLEAVYHFERPVFRTAGVPLYLLSERVKASDIKVVLTGEGADELLYGYDSYKELKLLDFWKKNPKSTIRPLLIKKLYPHLQHYNNPKQYGLMRMYYEGFLSNDKNEIASLNIRIHNNKIISNYLNKDSQIEFGKESLVEKIKAILPDNYHTWTSLQQNQFLEMKTLLSGYLLSSQGDRMSLAHGVEGRYPFLDHRIVEKLFYYKDRFKLNGFSQKHLLRKSFQNRIPTSIVNRPKKPYTAPDLKSFFHNGDLSEQASYFLSEQKIKEYGIFNEKPINRLIKKFRYNVPTEIGYRDNMLITFILSCQMVHYWTLQPKSQRLEEHMMTVNIIDK